ncbi:MAG: NrdH-redoxin [Flavobacteriales bacterium]|nr:NrdH-redoxin [Flavobacteriales bacterium]MBL4735857.1 NrdH-redoxin [Flavobacteriales bacterium]
MKTIVIYGTTWCADCHTAKSILDSLNVEYDFINIDEDESAASRVMELNGGKRIVPTIFINGAVYTNPSQLELMDLVRPFVHKKAS